MDFCFEAFAKVSAGCFEDFVKVLVGCFGASSGTQAESLDSLEEKIEEDETSDRCELGSHSGHLRGFEEEEEEEQEDDDDDGDGDDLWPVGPAKY